ncbi:MAG: substrate-binding domain-containing protein [Gammaproteobacteria bacterium]|nr:substrate-binding domain-containing protein [Gammaproteobacteria bacterium]MDH3505925.1 substrate-binding domain-containing protein [Gammaproteobacteria bacterium]
MKTVSLALLLICSITASCSAQQAGQPPSLRVLSSNGPRAPLEDVQMQIEAAIGYSLDIEFSTSVSLTNRIEAGESFDVAILTPALIERLVAGSHVAAEPVPVFARSGVGIGAASSNVARDVSTMDAMRATLLAAESVTLTADGQSRRVSEAAFETLGIVEQMARKIVLVGPGEGPHVVARGEAELVLTLISEIVPVEGLELVGPFPAELQDYVSFAAGISNASTQTAAARQLLEQLTSPAMMRALEPHGMEALTR